MLNSRKRKGSACISQSSSINGGYMNNIIKKMMTLLVVLLVAGVVSAAEMVTLKLKKLDGTEVTKEVEKPQYGGSITDLMRAGLGVWDPMGGRHIAHMTLPIFDNIWQMDWTRGSAGTGEARFTDVYPLWSYATGGVAEHWEFTDGNSIRLRMRRGIHFWNKEDVAQPHEQLATAYGREADAEDVAFAVNLNSTLWGQPYKAVPLDKRNVIIQWELANYTSMPQWWISVFAAVLPRELGELDRKDWKNALGTGPFIPSDYVSGGTTTFKRNPNYWDYDPLHPENRLPYLDGMKMVHFSGDWGAQVAALRTGKLDKIAPWYGVPHDYVIELSQTNPEVLHAPSSANVLHMPVRQDLEPWSDQRVRHAAMLAIDQQGIVDDFYQGNAEIVHNLTYKGQEPYYMTLEEKPSDVRELFGYNPEKAKQLLTEAGYPNGFDTEIVTAVFPEESEMFAGYLSAVGINAEIKVMDLTALENLLMKPGHMGMAVKDSGSPGLSPWHWLTFDLNATMPHVGHITDPSWDANFQDATSTADPEERLNKWKAINVTAMRNSWALFSVAYYPHNFWQQWLKNYNGEQGFSLNFWYTNKFLWVDCALKKEKSGRECND